MTDDKSAILCLFVDLPENREFMTSLGFDLADPMLANLFVPYRDSVQGRCQNCARAIWLGPEGRRFLDVMGEDAAYVLCMICGTLHAKQHGIAAEDVMVLSDKKPGE